MEENSSPRRNARLKEIAGVFLKLGCTAFGGPSAHIAMMENELVQKRAWLSRETFLDLLSATNFIPGPNSTEMAIHLGHLRGKLPGLFLAGCCFILPAACLVTLLAWAYVHYGLVPGFQNVLYGVKPVVIAVVLQAIWSLSRSTIKSRFLAALGIAALLANALGSNELLVIAMSGLISYCFYRAKTKQTFFGIGLVSTAKPYAFGALVAATASALNPVTSAKIFFFFLKVGSVLYGSGYVLVAYLRTDLVEKWHWLTEAQLLDAIAVGQLTPGPVFTTATFIGYLLAGFKGAALATVGIFAPAFIFVALTAPLVARLRTSPAAAATLDGINVASLAVMTVTCLLLSQQALVDVWTVALAIVASIALIRFKINSVWLILGAGTLGYFIR